MNRDARTAAVALVVTLAIQAFTSLAATTPAVLAPALAADMGISASWIGVFVGLVYAGAMLSSIVSIGFMERYGAIRVSQICVILCAAGIAMVGALPASAAPLLAGAAVLLGLGYGPITPASSQILIRTIQPSRMALMFSIKQTGVPVGAALAGALLPAVAIAVGWRTAAIAVGLVGVLIALVAQSTQRALDTDAQPGRAFSVGVVVEWLRLVATSPALAELAALSFAYASVQVCMLSYLVVYLHDTLQWSLVEAGLALTAMTVGGVFGRIGWGAVADRMLNARRVLTLIGCIASACALTLACATPEWPTGAVLSLVAVLGGTAIGWNGVQLAELARHAPEGGAGAVTAAASVITFAGVVAGPPSFAALAAMTAGYRSGFVALSLVSLGAAAAFHWHGPPRRRDAPKLPSTTA
ncbi:MAG: MFS transporter [Acidobacteria bacterium]|nr:MFS transporter [Acidobacteriota bacterium]